MKRLIVVMVVCFSIFGIRPGLLRAEPQAAGPSFVVTKVRLFPRAGHAAEMKGGKFVGSLTSATNDFEDLVAIQQAPAEGQWTELAVPIERARAYRFVKYLAANDSPGSVAELEFLAGDRKLAGVPFATTGGSDPHNDPKFAFDGDNSTFFTGAGTFGQYVGLDLGPASQAAQPIVSVAQGTYKEPQTVSLSCATPGATIVYNLDSSWRPQLNAKGEPEGDSRVDDGKPLTISKSSILQAVAIRKGLADSTPSLAAYRIGEAADATEHAEFHIGNSLTDTVNNWMEPLAASGGHKIRYYRFTIPGAPTDWLWDHPGSGFGENRVEQAFIARAPLTDLITQPFAGHGRSISNEAEYSGRFLDLARKSSPDVQMWLYVQWPGTDWSRDGWANGKSSRVVDGKEQPVRFADPAKTWQDAIRNHVRYTELVMEEMNAKRADEIRAGKCKPVLIIPGGLALAELKTRIDAGQVPGTYDVFAETFAGPNDFHMTPKGAYLIALVHYACLYRDDPRGKVTAANSNLTPEQAAIVQSIAWETAQRYLHSGLRR